MPAKKSSTKAKTTTKPRKLLRNKKGQFRSKMHSGRDPASITRDSRGRFIKSSS